MGNVCKDSELTNKQRTTLRLRSFSELSAKAARLQRSNRTALVKCLAILWITYAGSRRVVHRFLGPVDNFYSKASCVAFTLYGLVKA